MIRKQKIQPRKGKQESIAEETGFAFIEFMFGSISSKTGVGILFLVLGLAFLLAPMSDGETKPLALYIIGCISLIIAILIIANRLRQIKRKSDK